MREFLELKYGKFVTDQLMNDQGEVLTENKNKDNTEHQNQVKAHLKTIINKINVDSLPKALFNEDVEWGMDFSSWIGSISTKKDYLFIGSEPHVENNYQTVYDFGNQKNKTLEEIALKHSETGTIWDGLIDIFVEAREDKNQITEFLNRCYITDLCHIVPKNCGQVISICSKLSINPNDWHKFRTMIAKEFLVKEIEILNPKIIILHGNPSRKFFQKEFNVKYEVHPIADSKFTIKTGKLNGYKVISIPHLRGDMKNKLWRCKKYPERPLSANKIIKNYIYSEN